MKSDETLFTEEELKQPPVDFNDADQAHRFETNVLEDLARADDKWLEIQAASMIRAMEIFIP